MARVRGHVVDLVRPATSSRESERTDRNIDNVEPAARRPDVGPLPEDGDGERATQSSIPAIMLGPPPDWPTVETSKTSSLPVQPPQGTPDTT